jgi:hypothetical protein
VVRQNKKGLIDVPFDNAGSSILVLDLQNNYISRILYMNFYTSLVTLELESNLIREMKNLNLL